MSIGPNNKIEPGDPDQGQPTFFETGRQWGVFVLKVPKDFGTKSIKWTITSNGETQSIPFTLNPGYPTEPKLLSAEARKGLRVQLAARGLRLAALMDNLSLTADDAAHAAKKRIAIHSYGPAGARDAVRAGSTIYIKGGAGGSLTLTATITEDMQSGLVAIPFGWWNRDSPEGRTVNALTNPTVGADGRGSAHFHDTLVQVTRVG